MKIAKKLTAPAALICIFTIVLSAFSGCKKNTVIFESDAFGKNYSVEFFSEDEETALSFFSLMDKAVKETAHDLSLSDEDSQLNLLNKDKLIYGTAAFKKSITDAVTVCTILGDTVDITAGRAMRLWSFNTEKPSVPDSKKLSKAVKNISLDKISIAAQSSKITIEQDIEIDMSAMAEGIACDNAYETAKLCKVPYIMTLGNMLFAYGEGPEKGNWEADIRNPLSDSGKLFGRLTLTPSALTGTVFLSVSGIHESSFTENGKNYHSILDPKTGYPPENDLLFVITVTDSGITADALSTALMINGCTEKSLSFLRSFSAEAVFVFSDNTYYVTEGLKDSLELADTSFTVRTAAP